MSFDSHSIERLRALGRQLPKSLAQPNSTKKKREINKNNQHPIETEKNPQVLFQEFMRASPDGNIPKHLIHRLNKLNKIFKSLLILTTKT